MPKLHVVVSSTRPGRAGSAIGRWFHGFAKAHGAFDASLLELADFGLPIYDEPFHPRMKKYQHEHTKKWAASVASADAFVFVVPEYNYAPPPAFVNAIDYLYDEWNYKAAGFVSYGGVSGGLRSAQVARSLASTVKMIVPPEGVAIPNFGAQLNEAKEFTASELNAQGAKALLDEMAKLEGALKTLRG